jgi:hypothetical protein
MKSPTKDSTQRCSFCQVEYYIRRLVWSKINNQKAICSQCIKIAKKLTKPVRVVK